MPLPAPEVDLNIGGEAQVVIPERVLRDNTFVTEPQRVEYFLRTYKHIDARAIATDRFLQKSRDQYGPQFLAREIIQNFVDHNVESPGTLDGVLVSQETVGESLERFTIEGNWPFLDATGIVTPHSDKPDTFQTAGGNGIGLKQTAIRLLRDYGVEKFSVVGEGWTVDYKIAKAHSINSEWMEDGDSCPAYPIMHDWLVGEIRQSENTGKCLYIVETDNPDIIGCFEKMQELGVSSENPYLQDPDYVSSKGKLKWLPFEKGDEEASRGRLFINGQVMNYKDKGYEGDYWRGPEYITVELDNISYNMSMDRPPVSVYDLGKYVEQLTREMSFDDAATQLQKSEYIWTEVSDTEYSSDRKACFVVIESLVNRLTRDANAKEVFDKYFPEKKYVYSDRVFSKEQLSEIADMGYTICPSYFQRIGMPSAGTVLSEKEVNFDDKKPGDIRWVMEKMSQEVGIEVGHEDFSGIKTSADFFKLIARRLAKYSANIQITDSDDLKTLRVFLNTNIPDHLLSHSLPVPKKGESDQELLFFLRGVTHYALSKKISPSVLLSQGHFATTFGTRFDSITDSDVLVARNNRIEGDNPVFFEIKARGGYADEMESAFSLAKPFHDGGKSPWSRFRKNKPGQEELGDDYLAQLNESGLSYGESEKSDSGNVMKLMGRMGDIIKQFDSAKVKGFGQEEKGPPQEGSEGHKIKDFKIIKEPSEDRIKQIDMLRNYVGALIRSEIPTQLFYFSGEGATGVNLGGGKAIGIHEEVAKTSLEEAVSVVIHELAHNFEGPHGTKFFHITDALHAATRDVLNGIAARSGRGFTLSSGEQEILRMPEKWNALRRSG